MTTTINTQLNDEASHSGKNSPVSKDVKLDPKDVGVNEHRRESVDLSKQFHLKQQFMDDEAIGQSFIFQLFTLLFVRVAQWFHGYKGVGFDKIPKDSGALLVGFHSTHNQDILPGILGTYDILGRVPRGLLHRIVFTCYPWVCYLGLVPGQRKTAKQLLKKNFLVAVLPGGGEEAMYGHEHAYDLHPRWNDRKGFATVAKDAGVPIVPMFTKNVEEMRFNPIFWFLNLIGFTRFYSRTADWLNEKSKADPKSKAWKRAAWAWKQMGLVSWFMGSWLTLWVPVEVTCYAGEPLYFDKDEDVNVIAKRTKEALQALIDEHQPHGHSYWPGLVERYNNIFTVKEEAEVVAKTKKDD